jgi:inner membrane protein
MASRLIDSGSITFKAVMIGMIVLILLVPLTMLRGLVNERSNLREQAYTRVAEGWGGNSVIGGPMLVVPTERTVFENNSRKLIRTELYLLPAQLDIGVDMAMEKEPRYVGIYAVPVYQSSIKLSGRFDFAALQPLLGGEGVTYLWEQSRVRLPVSQSRSLREVREARFAGRDLKLGPASPGLFRGVEAAIDLAPLLEAQGAEFLFDTVMAGSREFSVLPVGSTSSIVMRSDWPHPSFQGAFLPVERSISAQGFEARWQVLELNRSYRQAWTSGEVDDAMLMESAIGVGLYQAVDVYQRAERAIKYALLFIALTFLTFFAWEQLSNLRLHPLQYLLVGLALSMFYVLLIALSEHVRFIHAYFAAAAALVTLMGIYVSGALHSSRCGVAVGSAMTVVYGLLYALILSEDYALLMGAITLFAALAAVMVATRKIDWYRLGSDWDLLRGRDTGLRT